MARNELDSLEKDLLSAAKDLKNGQYAKKFLRKEGTKLNRVQKRQAKSSGIGKNIGNFMKGFKRGKPYKYDGDMAIRAYNKSPHAHLLNDGHRIVAPYTGEEKGFKEGTHFMEKAGETFQDTFIDDCSDFVDDLLQNHGLY